MLGSWLASAMLQWKAGPTVDGFDAAVVSIGNDAGDLDSLVSSIAMADFQPIGGCGGRPLWLPVVPFPRSDFRLRQDACILFRHVGMAFDEAGAPTDLLHLDEVDVETAVLWRTAGGLGVALVDHNACLPDVSARFGARIVAIVDHHNDEGSHLELAAGERDVAGGKPDDALSRMLEGSAPLLRLVHPEAGSTCSLLVELMDSTSPGGGGLSARSPELRVLLLAAIAVDTRGLEPSLLGQKYCAADVRAAQTLYASFGVSIPKRLPPKQGAGAEAFETETVLEALVALREVALPAVAQLGGAATIGELSDRLLAARYDVRALSTLELMRWDYKEAVRAPTQASGGEGMKVGVAAICETADELLRRSGGVEGLEAAMVEAAQRRGGLGLLLALTKEDASLQGRKGLVALLPSAQGSRPGTREAAESLLQALSGVPTLPPALSSNALFAAQQIETEGFGIEWERVEGAPRLRRSKLRALATRKTLMPAMLQL